MNILRLSTLSLTLAAAVVTLGYANLSFAGPKNCVDNDPRPSCGDDGGAGGITYGVELMGRVFNFAPGVDFTADNKQENLLPDPDIHLTLSRPPGADPCNPNTNIDADEAACAWDAVFAACENFFGPNPIDPIGPTPTIVSYFTVPAGNWRINKFGGVRLQMSRIPFDSMGNPSLDSNGDPIEGQDPYFTVSLQLIGDTLFDNPDSPWLPDSGEPNNYNIVDFSIIGKTVKGVHPKKGCVSGGSAEGGDFDPGETRTLVISAP